MLNLFSVKRSNVCLLLLDALQQTANQKLSSEAHVTSVSGHACCVNCSRWEEISKDRKKFKEIFTYVAPCSLSSFHETSRRISPLWEVLPSNLSWRPIGSRQSKWLANCHEACKYDELERQYKCGARDNYVRIFFFTLLNLGYGLNYYSSQLRFAHSRAGLMAAPLQRSGEYDIFLKVGRMPSDQRWTFGTQVMSSCRLNVRIPLTVEPAGQDISPASHAPFHGGAESRRQMLEQRDLTSPQMPHGKIHCLSMQPPPQAAFCCVQSTIT